MDTDADPTGLVAETARALLTLQQQSWPDAAVSTELGDLGFSGAQGELAARRLAASVEQLCASYPNLRIFWKDAELRFLGMSESLAREAGLPDVASIVGLTDVDERVVWSRQGAKYRRDDREVMRAGAPLMDIVERQDALGDDVRWLRTSKVPIQRGDRVVGLAGGFEVIDAETAREISRRSAK